MDLLTLNIKFVCQTDLYKYKKIIIFEVLSYQILNFNRVNFTNLLFRFINYLTQFKMLVKNSMAYLEFVLRRVYVAAEGVQNVEEKIVVNGKILQ